MKLKFCLHYNTSWGLSLHVLVRYYRHDGRYRDYNLPMTTMDGDLWTLETAAVESRQHPINAISYCYQVENQEGEVVRREWDLIPRLYSFDGEKDYDFRDAWRDVPVQYHLYSDAYVVSTGRQAREQVHLVQVPLFRRTVIFRVSAPQLQPGESLAVCGNHPALGNWNPSQYIRMVYMGNYEWILSVDILGIQLPIEYKYVVVDEKTSQLKAWEEGWNRTTGDANPADGQVLVLYSNDLHLCEKIWRGAGVVVPVFALRSEHSYGVGDFGDLKRLVDWAAACGMKAIQVLPVNDTTSTHSWTDSHPYNCISAFALHPHYLDLEQMEPLKDERKMNVFRKQRRELNALSYSDYMAVDRVKASYVDEIYQQNSAEVFASVEYMQFFDENAFWLVPYAAFCLLRDHYRTARYTDWGAYAHYDAQAIVDFCKETPDVQKVYYVQFFLHQQLKAASNYAHAKGVFLKGDLPIGVYRDSVETWMHPGLFNMDAQMGTPPDAESHMGQNWGFPTYNWLAFELSDYEWWHQRFHYLEQFFDAIRIDHIVGYFRIWEIPQHALFGTLGHYSPSLPMTEEEITDFGLPFHRELFTQPFINDDILKKIFGIHAQYVKDNILERKAYNLYRLKEAYNTQVKVQAAFASRTDENSLWIRDGLYRLIGNVLFLEDPYRSGMYFPRFGASSQPVFNILSPEEKDAYIRLYHHYYHARHHDYWAHLATLRLRNMLKGTRMLVCGEDLGMLPDCITHVLDEQRILTLEIQTMPKDSEYEFAHLEANAYRSVCTISTHDMAPMRLWWEENPARTQRFYTTMLQKEGKAPQHLPTNIAEEMISRHLYCPSMLCMLSIQDWLSMSMELWAKDIHEERINTPQDAYNPWKYRMNVNIEDLLKSTPLNKKIKLLITRSKR